ncbi:hypothetical protein IM792_17780 [Mucilaginibacter sp. JRF]|uniref:hypothetical protein n=1 Tax=Mucilaginibacter sp. JRF TaxID=2780088 RepID=UPI0018814179|nr:hypothetical protein [Mucilaginibacter sp. JRF]MBE9586307.1 hypothetical protein [Mucilaginibacter sp. JRF]
MGITGINILILVGYTLLCGVLGEDGLLLQLLFVLVHAGACVIIAPFARKWEWVLAGLLVLIIGLSSCYGLMVIQGGFN